MYNTQIQYKMILDGDQSGMTSHGSDGARSMFELRMVGPHVATLEQTNEQLDHVLCLGPRTVCCERQCTQPSNGSRSIGKQSESG